jgi:hypothetical protein
MAGSIVFGPNADVARLVALLMVDQPPAAARSLVQVIRPAAQLSLVPRLAGSRIGGPIRYRKREINIEKSGLKRTFCPRLIFF